MIEKWPLMKNNILESDLLELIEFLKLPDPKLTHGRKVKEFENAWSNWLGVKYSVMVNSGASANDLTMMALREIHGIGEVVVPGLTWVSDVSAILNAGHKPIFVDVDLDTLAMNVKSVLNSLTPRTKAVFLTHILGINGLSDELLYALDKNNVLLIEDACESHGARHNNKKVGTFGWASNFSFYYAHHMTTIEGGMISTNDYELYNLLLVLRSHGMARESNSIEYKNNIAKQYSDLNPDFIFMAPSHNMRPTEINGVLGLAQLKRLDVSIEKRHANFLRFLSLLDPKIFFTDLRIQGNSSYAFILILRQKNLKLRNLLESKLSEQGIEFRRGLSGGGNQLRQPYLRRLNSIPAPETLPNVDHVHHFAWYIGNYPDINPKIFDALKIALEDIANI